MATTTDAIAPSGVAMNASGRDSTPRSSSTLLKNPRPGNASNIHRQVSAMMTVDVIHGSRKRPRAKLRPRTRPSSTSAMAIPVAILSATETTVNTRLLRIT